MQSRNDNIVAEKLSLFLIPVIKTLSKTVSFGQTSEIYERDMECSFKGHIQRTNSSLIIH